MEDATVERAERLLRGAAASTTRVERRRSRRLGRLLSTPAGRELLFGLADRVMRAPDDVHALTALRSLTAGGLPAGLDVLDRVALRAAGPASAIAPSLVVRLARARVRRETEGVILPAEDPAFRRYIAGRTREGVTVNVNVLGEAILGDAEADARLDRVLGLLGRPDVTYISVKISALCANLDVLAFEHSVGRIVDRLSRLYRAAADARPAKFVNLDMEEYRDLHLTVSAFTQTLDLPEFHSLPAGIALQAYLPDSHDVLASLAAWAGRRQEGGGAPIKVRIVKGANLAMEQVEAEIAGWEQAPYPSKADVDASYKRLLDSALAAGAGVRIGAASHNLFDLAWALERRAEAGAVDRVDIEMLEGMAPAQARAVGADAGGLVLYAPVVEESDFSAAIAYLARRLDENSGPENFLRVLFSITADSPAWDAQRRRFEDALAGRRTVPTCPRRTQDRRTDNRTFDPDAPFVNEPDTDFTLAANRAWIAAHFARPWTPPPVATSTTIAAVDEAVARARAATAGWQATSDDERARILNRVAEVMAANRGTTLVTMARETGKTVHEGDPEVSEGLDATRWAAASIASLPRGAEPRGVVLVVGPWNFPYAIPANGVAGALAAGSTVLLKPAPEAISTAAELVRHFHDGGVPVDALQLVVCPEDDVGRHLITHDGIDQVVLTGAYDTARLFLGWKPSLRLIAETSGKNALVVSAAADHDLAIRDLVRSAFGHAGQKCSAASLAILDASVYDDDRFLGRLADAVRSLRVGDATDPATMMGPLIRPPGPTLLRALTTLDGGEAWLVEPRRLSDVLWTPGVKMGVQPGSWFHQTECFGPVLGVMRARDLAHAIQLQNGTPFGLTGGLHTLDPDEIEQWLSRIAVGNCYVNRHVTGAIIRRQPFGGWKRSSVGPGAKTGGPNDVLRFVRFATPLALPSADDIAASYADWWGKHFGAASDPTALRSEQNLLRYRPIGGVLCRVDADVTADELGALHAAASITNVRLTLSTPPGTEVEEAIVESDATLAARLARAGVDRLRLLAPVGDAVRVAAHDANIRIDDTPVTGDGRVELPMWLREQAISRTMHRHGRIAEGR